MNMGVNAQQVLGLVIAFMCLAYTTPIALNYLAVAVNTSVNSSVKTIMTIVVPIIFALAVVLYFFPRTKGG